MENLVWDKEKMEAKCTIELPSGTLTTVAKCHPDDYDFVNEFTGCEIASRRMSIKILQIHKHELNSRLSALNQLYYSMKHSKRFNEKSYENKMLQRQINMVKQDIQTIKEMIEKERNNLKSYIDAKDDFYKKVRTNRKKDD